METVKTLLESTKQNLEMQLWWAEEHDKEPQFIKEIPILKQKIADIDEALLLLFSVSGRSEQLKEFAKKCRNQLYGGVGTTEEFIDKVNNEKLF